MIGVWRTVLGVVIPALIPALIAVLILALGPRRAVAETRTSLKTGASVVELITMPDGSIRSRASEGGRVWSRWRPLSYEIMLRDFTFDPLDAGQPDVADILRGGERDDVASVYIVQFMSFPLEAHRDAVEACGATVRTFLSRHAHLVEMSPETRQAVEALPIVRWVGPFHPAYRLEQDLRIALMTDAPLEQTRYSIMLMDAAMESRNAVADRIVAAGGHVDRRHAGKFLVEATVDAALLLEIAGWNEVLFIDRWSPLEKDMALAREIGGANYVESVEGFDGHGVRGEVLDAGFNLEHVDFQSRPLVLHTAVDSDSHGAATSGIIFGDGTGNPAARGMAPGAQGIVADWHVINVGPGRYAHTGELVQPPYEALFQSASVGSQQTTEYTTVSADIDAALFDFDIVLCQSQSNLLSQSSRPQAWAKNVVSVGGVRHRNTLTTADDCWGCESSGASIGPASDGRIKPDLCHFYDHIHTTTTGSPTAYTLTFGGTSGATPIVAGHFAIFFQMWADALARWASPGSSPFDARPHMTTAKAMMINSARPYDFDGPEHDLTRVHQGWGMPDLHAMLDRHDRRSVVDESDLLLNLDSTVYEVTVAPDEPDLRCTLVFADPAGNPAAGEHRVNDLSLRVTAPDGTSYWGNNGLLDGLWSTPGGSSNTIDTVENVFIESPIPGTWQVEVIADEIIEDGHVETAALDADYALVVTGVIDELQPLHLSIPGGPPMVIAPGTPVEIIVRVAGAFTPPAVLMTRSSPGDAFDAIPLTPLDEFHLVAMLPPFECGDTPEFFIVVEGDDGQATLPDHAPDSTFELTVGSYDDIWHDDFEDDAGWVVENDRDLTAGAWERGVPAGGGLRADPPLDFDGSGSCMLTGNAPGDSDVDGGTSWLTSPRLDLTSSEAVIDCAIWYSNNTDNDPNNDLFHVQLSDDDGQTWVNAITLGPIAGGGWTVQTLIVADHVTPTDAVRLRFEVSDLHEGSIVEAAVDAVRIRRFVCSEGCPGDGDGDEHIGVTDLLALLAAWGSDHPIFDLVGDDDVVDVLDLLALLADWGPCA